MQADRDLSVPDPAPRSSTSMGGATARGGATRGSRRSASVAADREVDQKFAISDSADWGTCYEDFGRWGKDTERLYRTVRVTKLGMQNLPKDINRPMFPGSPRPETGAKDWKPDYRQLGEWGQDTFRRWIPPVVTKQMKEVLPTRVHLDFQDRERAFDNIKASSLVGPKGLWDDV
mmetsp:Transcript_32555/g.77066  ORF Transcript_32555/g.77066 Transcript_32555/m.77066 type:complete len:175 (-) Transcript_32555:116-640(-)